MFNFSFQGRLAAAEREIAAKDAEISALNRQLVQYRLTDPQLVRLSNLKYYSYILDRNLAKANCTVNLVCTSCDTVVLDYGPFPSYIQIENSRIFPRGYENIT